MSRIRTIKPEFFRSLTLEPLGDFEKLLFIGLWTYADDGGKGVDNPRLIKGDLFPLRDEILPADIEYAMRKLAYTGVIQRYTVHGQRLFKVTAWSEHQRINKPSKSKLPDPEIPDQGLDPDLLREGYVNTPVDVPFDYGVERNREQGTGNGTGKGKDIALLRKNSEAPRNELWDAVVAVCRIDSEQILSGQRQLIGRAVKELTAAGARPQDVFEQGAAYRLAYPEMPLTVSALIKHWGSVAGVATQPKVDKNEMELRQWVNEK